MTRTTFAYSKNIYVQISLRLPESRTLGANFNISLNTLSQKLPIKQKKIIYRNAI